MRKQMDRQIGKKIKNIGAAKKMNIVVTKE